MTDRDPMTSAEQLEAEVKKIAGDIVAESTRILSNPAGPDAWRGLEAIKRLAEDALQRRPNSRVDVPAGISRGIPPDEDQGVARERPKTQDEE